MGPSTILVQKWIVVWDALSSYTITRHSTQKFFRTQYSHFFCSGVPITFQTFPCCLFSFGFTHNTSNRPSMVHQMMPVTNLCYKLYAFFVLTVLIAGMSLMALISFAVYFTLGGMEFGFTIIGSLLYFLIRYMIPRQRSLDVSSMSCKECTVLTTKELAINTSLYEKNEETKIASSCSICLEHFSNGESLSTIGTCKHIFHHDCLDQWIQRSTSCPYCRRGIERRSSIKHAKKEITLRIFDELSIPIYR